MWYVIMIVSGKYFCSPKSFPLAIRADANFQFALVSWPPVRWHVGSLFSPHTPEAGRVRPAPRRFRFAKAAFCADAANFVL